MIDNILKLIEEIAREGNVATLVLRRSTVGEMWIASVVATDGTILCDRNGNMFLVAQRRDAEEALRALDDYAGAGL